MVSLYRNYWVTSKFRRTVFLSYVLFSIVSGLLFAAEDNSIAIQGADTVYHLSHNDIKTGERLFYGLIREQSGQRACISCHVIKPTDSLNWNPSAFEVASISHSKTLEELKATLFSPAGKRLSLSHTGYTELSDVQLAALKGYLLELFEQGEYKPKPVIDKLLYFSGLLILFILAFLDLIWFRVIRYRFIHIAVLTVVTVFITKVIVEESIAIGRSKNYEPDQPIKFSHTVHAGQNKIDCLYCHNGAEYSKSAGIPATSVCLNCHMVVRDGTRSGRFEINKIFAALDQNKPVQWKQVYNLPDHVFFSHAQHVSAGKIACLTCHGSVEQMDRVSQVTDLSMGWCINCHRDSKVQFHDNNFYEKYADLRKKVEKSEIDSVTVAMVGGTDCMKCHY